LLQVCWCRSGYFPGLFIYPQNAEVMVSVEWEKMKKQK